MSCDMCGSEGVLYNCKIEGTVLKVCRNCAKHGELLGKVKEPKPIKEAKNIIAKSQTEIIQIITSKYSQLVKNQREKLGLKQKKLAQKIAEKESLIHSIESGHFKPGIDLARKLERFLHITLVEQYEEKKDLKFTKSEDSVITLGDLIKIKK